MLRRLLALIVALLLMVPQLAPAGLWLCRADETVHTACCCDGPDAGSDSADACCDHADDEDDDPIPPFPVGPLPARWNLVGAEGPRGARDPARLRAQVPPVPVARGPPLYLAHASLLR